jgi:hypothetical protein
VSDPDIATLKTQVAELVAACLVKDRALSRVLAVLDYLPANLCGGLRDSIEAARLLSTPYGERAEAVFRREVERSAREHDVKRAACVDLIREHAKGMCALDCKRDRPNEPARWCFACRARKVVEEMDRCTK